MPKLREYRVYNRDDKTDRRYQLRYAAGLYWLVDMKQSGTSYIEPVPLNETGARIWEMLDGGIPKPEVCSRLCKEYKLLPEEAEKDVRDFITQLKTKRVDFGGSE